MPNGDILHIYNLEVGIWKKNQCAMAAVHFQYTNLENIAMRIVETQSAFVCALYCLRRRQWSKQAFCLRA